MTSDLLRLPVDSLHHILQFLVSLGLIGFDAGVAFSQVTNTVSEPLRQHQYDLSTEGRPFLLKEAANVSFFLLGELHGENEIPALIRDLWPAMWRSGYRNIAAELSPWVANQLEFSSQNVTEPIRCLWSQTEATYVASFKKNRTPVLWGCDIEEIQPHFLIRDLASANPKNQVLQSIAEMTKTGYQRSMSPELLRRLQNATQVKDILRGGVSLQESISSTLQVEIDRLNNNTRLQASNRREAVMKKLFHRYYQKSPKSKVFARFGRNHLHRGLDRRGVSTLGNFMVELAITQGRRAFNLAAFAAGGKISLLDSLLDWDERKDDPAFEFLASLARYPATIFDLRPIRQALHRIPENQRSQVEASLVYWADSYDAILCYREVTPLSQ